MYKYYNLTWALSYKQLQFIANYLRLILMATTSMYIKDRRLQTRLEDLSLTRINRNSKMGS